MLYVQQPKKLLIMNILDILKRYSDADHRLTQKNILDILQKEYNMAADRKAVKRNLMSLIDFGCHLAYSEKTRKNQKGEDEVIFTDWYLERDFTDAELRLLIDSLLFSKHIPYSQCRDLIEKIKGLSNQYFQSKVRHVCNLPTDQPVNRELFWTVEVLDDAIEQGRQVSFSYGDYATDLTLHLRPDGNQQSKRYLVNPYQMVATNGRYYLIGNHEKYDNVSHYRIDRISDIQMLQSPAKPQREVKGIENGLNLPRHMAEHIYMFAGESRRVTMKTTPDMIGELVDWFGNGVTFSEETEQSVIASVTVNLSAMRFWALQYAPYVTVISPQELVDTIKQDLKSAAEKYGEGRSD